MGKKINKYLNFWKSSSRNHYIFWASIFLIFVVLITLFQIQDSNLDAYVLLVVVLIFFFVLGHVLTIFFFNMVKNLFTKIVNLNNFSYGELTPERKIPALLVVLPAYLIIFQTYFIIAGYNFIEALLFGWLVLLFVRSSHYVDKELGAEIGKIIGSFFIPFGFVIILIKGSSFYVDLSTSKIFIEDYIGYIIYFIVFLLATIPLEVLMEYRGKNKQKDNEEKRKRTEWKNDPRFVKYKMK